MNINYYINNFISIKSSSILFKSKLFQNVKIQVFCKNKRQMFKK